MTEEQRINLTATAEANRRFLLTLFALLAKEGLVDPNEAQDFLLAQAAAMTDATHLDPAVQAATAEELRMLAQHCDPSVIPPPPPRPARPDASRD